MSVTRAAARLSRPAPRAALTVTVMRLFNVFNRLLKKGPVAPTELDEAVNSFQQKTGVRFKDPGLLRVALTHGSYVHEHPDTGLESMGRMELLGDSVLGLVVNEYLYASFPAFEEGELTKMKSLLVSKAVLARRGRNMRLGSYLLLGEGEVDAGGRDRTSIVADGYESVIGATYLDQGLEGARKFIGDTLLGEARKILADSKHINYKSLLQEQVQGELRVHPEYRVLSETGPEHEKQFVVEVAVRRKPLGRGSGKSKKEAEQAAAKEALQGLEQAGEGRNGAKGERGGGAHGEGRDRGDLGSGAHGESRGDKNGGGHDGRHADRERRAHDGRRGFRRGRRHGSRGERRDAQRNSSGGERGGESRDHPRGDERRDQGGTRRDHSGGDRVDAGRGEHLDREQSHAQGEHGDRDQSRPQGDHPDRDRNRPPHVGRPWQSVHGHPVSDQNKRPPRPPRRWRTREK